MTSHRKRVRVWPEIWNHLKTTDQKLEVKLRSKSARFMYTKSLTHYIQLSTFTTLNVFFMHNSQSRKSRNPIKIAVDKSQNARYQKRPFEQWSLWDAKIAKISNSGIQAKMADSIKYWITATLKFLNQNDHHYEFDE